MEVILSETDEVLRIRTPLREDGEGEGVIIVRHKLGFVYANAAVDESNTEQDGQLILLPVDPDASARRLRTELETQYEKQLGIVISDTFGRPWRIWQVNVAIGLAGVPAVVDLASTNDAMGRELSVTMPAISDELAAAAGLVMGKNTNTPVIHIRGVNWPESNNSIKHLIRDQSENLF